MCLSSMAGTPVLNIRTEARQGSVALRPLIEGFFRQGGMQVQVTIKDHKPVQVKIKGQAVVAFRTEIEV
jgi:predicted PhzF superfamily epimerase YddE/YHI9